MPGLCRKCAAHGSACGSHPTVDCPFGACTCDPCRKIDEQRSYARNAAKKASARKKAEQEQHKRGAQSYDALKASLDAAFDIAARERHQGHQPAQPAQPHLSDCSGAAPSVPDFQDDPGQRGQRYQADGVATAPAAVAASAPNADYVVIPVLTLGATEATADASLCTEYVVSERSPTTRPSTSPASSGKKTRPQRCCKRCFYHGLATATNHSHRACPYWDCQCSPRCVGLLEARAAKARWLKEVGAYKVRAGWSPGASRRAHTAPGPARPALAPGLEDSPQKGFAATSETDAYSFEASHSSSGDSDGSPDRRSPPVESDQAPLRSHAEQPDQGGLGMGLGPSTSRHQSAVVACSALDDGAAGGDEAAEAEKPGVLAAETSAPLEANDARHPGGVNADGSMGDDDTGGLQHGVEARAAVEGVPCPDCSQLFRNRTDLQGHLDVVHMELLPLERVHELTRLLQALSTEGASEDPSPRED